MYEEEFFFFLDLVLLAETLCLRQINIVVFLKER